LETSIAKTISTPSRFTVSKEVPIFGLTKAMIKQEKAKDRVMNFKMDLNKD
jgi:hypothetical protein